MKTSVGAVEFNQLRSFAFFMQKNMMGRHWKTATIEERNAAADFLKMSAEEFVAFEQLISELKSSEELQKKFKTYEMLRTSKQVDFQRYEFQVLAVGEKYVAVEFLNPKDFGAVAKFSIYQLKGRAGHPIFYHGSISMDVEKELAYYESN